MNLPERFELLTLATGIDKVTVIPDTRIRNAIVVEIQLEDHTLGAMLTASLQRDPRVLFAGYKVPHPLENFIQVRVQTVDNVQPTHVLLESMSQIIKDLMEISSRFKEELKRTREHTHLNAPSSFADHEADF